MTQADNTNKRLQQTINNAAQIFLAKNALLKDRNHFLININDEGKALRSTRSEILGKARVISYEDLEKARAERAVKEAAKEAKQVDNAGKRTHGRKRKSLEQATMLEAKAKMARMSEA